MKVTHKTMLLAIDKGYTSTYADTQSELQAWLRTKGIHIEMLVDMYTTRNEPGEVISDKYLCYSAFIYQVGQPAPMPWDDLGHADYEIMLEIALEHGLNKL